MQDAVVDILHERQALSHPPRLAIAISLALHLAIAAAVILTPAMESRMERARPMAINMRLASRPASPAGRTSSQPRLAPRPVPQATPAAKPAEEKPQPEKQVKGKVDPVRTAEKSVFGKSPEPATPKSKGTPAPAATGRPDGTASGRSNEFAAPGIGSAGVTGIEGGEFPYTMYIDRMTSMIGKNWFRPQASGDLITVVYFVIERDGRIRDTRVERSSGNRTFDRAAYRAVLESSPLAPLPMQYSGTHLGVHLTFH